MDNLQPNPVHFGFTGTRQGLDEEQIFELEVLLREFKKWHDTTHTSPPVFHHGDCIGADDQAASTANWLDYYVVAHPCFITSQRAYNPCSRIVLTPKAPLERNHDIVEIADYIIACPASQEEEQRSGTWATIRYARKMGKRVTLITP